MDKSGGKKQRVNFLLPVYLVMLPVIFILPYYSAPGYALLRHTTSHLGAQNTPNAWVMNTIFILLGAASMLEAWFRLQRFPVHKILLTVFGTGLIMTAVFQHAPILEGVPYSAAEDALHSVFATVVGFSFTLFAVAAAFIEKRTKRKASALLMAAAAVGFSLLIFSMPAFAGLWQRLMFMLSFAWLIAFLTTP